jgi:hypothetical protein
MGDFTITKWKCDRCEVVLDRRPSRLYGGAARYNVKIAADYGVTGGLEIDWPDMCDACNETVSGFIDMMRPRRGGASHG